MLISQIGIEWENLWGAGPNRKNNSELIKIIYMFVE